MRQRSMITNSEDSSLLHINQQNVSNYITYALEQEAALYAFFRIVEQKVGGRFWDKVAGGDLHSQKRKPGKMWKLD